MINFNINKKYLADALSWLGFRYYKYNTSSGVIYSFERTDEFLEAMRQLIEFKKIYGKKY